nr:reverse transcriptase domain-containing protein [Tanacetum cinerariifolium]
MTWEDLVSKFINQFFPPSKTTYLRNEITNFLQKPNEMFNEAWERFKDLLHQCPHHGFSELHQLDTFYNALNPNDQDALDLAAGGNFLDKIPNECLLIIESKSKVKYSRSRVIDVRENANAPPPPSSSHSNSFDLQQIAASLEDKLDIRMNRFEKSLNDMKNSFITLTASLKAVEEMRPSRFNQPTHQNNNQNSFQGNNFNQNQNHQTNPGAVYQNSPQQNPNFQAPPQQNTVTQGKFKTYTTANDANMNNLQLKKAKAITTRSGMSYKEPPVPQPGVDQQEPIEVTTDTELPSPKDIQAPLVQVEFQVDKPAEEPSVVIPRAKANLPYPSRLQKEKLRTQFRRCSCAHAEKKLRLPTLNDMIMVLELANRTISKPTGVVENVFVKVGKFYFPANFVVLDFVADPRVPLILGRPFMSTAHAIINIFEIEIIIRQNQQSLTIQCCDIPSVKKVEQINKIDFINAGGIDFESEEIEDFLNNDSIPFGVEDSPFNMDEDVLFLEILLREDLIPPHPINPNPTKLSIKETNHSLNMRYEHFNTNLVTKNVAESSTKNLIPIPNEFMVVSKNESQSTEPIDDNSLDSTIISNPLSDVECNSDESTSNHNTMKSDYFDEFYGPFIPIHILEEERIRRENADYINRMEMLFTINPRPHNPTNNNTNIESFSSFSIPNQESESRQEEIDVVSVTNDVLHPRDDDSDEEVDVVGDLRVDNFIQNSKHEYSESEDSDFDNPLLPLPPPEPPDKEFDFEIDFEK